MKEPFVAAILIIALIWLIGKWLAYYFSTLGLLYYLVKEHNDVLELEKIRELQQAALKKTIQDWFRKGGR